MATRKTPPPTYRPFTRKAGDREELWAVLVHGTQLKLKMGWMDQVDEQLYKRVEKKASKEAALAEADKLMAERRASGWIEQPAERMPKPDAPRRPS